MVAEVFRNIGLMGKPDSEQAMGSVLQLISYLEARHCRVILDKEIAQASGDKKRQAGTPGQLGQSCDLVIVVGGDGCFLGAARALARHGVPVLGVNRGRLGFLTDVLPAEIETRVGQVLDGDYTVEERFLLDMETVRQKTPFGEGTALNDVVLLSGESVHMIEFELYVDGFFVYAQRSDGLIISSPTGSTAYALSGGGPIMHPKLDAMVLVPLNPHTLSSRPIVIDGNSEVKIRIASHKVSPLVSCDGLEGIHLQQNDWVYVRKKRHRLKLIHPPGHDFYEACRSKLGWSTRLGEDN